MEYNYPEKKFDFYYLLIITFSSFGFFRPSFLETFIDAHFKNFYFDILLLLFLIAVPTIVKFAFQTNNYLFTRPVKLLGLAMLLSMLMAHFFWGQATMEGIFSQLPVACYLLYFYLMAKNISVRTVEKIIVVVGITYVCFYLLSFAINPIKIFEYKETKDRDFLRIFLFGDGFLFLFYFLALNKFLSGKSKIWIVLALSAYLCILLNQTRVYIGSTALITVFVLFRAKSMTVRFLSIALVVTAILIIPQLDYVQKLQKKTNKELKKNDDYIRIKSAKYYTDDFQPSVLTRVFGNGFPIGESSDYARLVMKMQLGPGYYTEDIGIIGLYVTMGVLAVIAFLIIFYRGLKAKLTTEHSYLKMFIVFLITTCFTTDSTFSASYSISIALTLYLYEHCRVEAQNIIVYIPDTV